MPSRPVYVGIGFGHAATLEKSEKGAVLTVRGPRGTAPVFVEITVSADGATIRTRDTLLHAPSVAAGASAYPPAEPATEQAPPVPRAPSVVPVAPVSTAPSFEPRLSLQQYASLRAECVSVAPTKLAEVRKRYALDEAGDTAEAEAWSRKFAQDAVLFDSYKRLFQMYRGPASSPPPPPKPSSQSPGVPSTQALSRVLTLGAHATMAAELIHSPADAVYAKYELSDPRVRIDVLRICEERLKDPQVMKTWKQLHALALQKIESGGAKVNVVPDIVGLVGAAVAGGSRVNAMTYDLIVGPFPCEVVSVRGREAVSELFAFDVSLASPVDAPVFETAALGMPVQLTMTTAGTSPRVVQGIVSRVRRQSTQLPLADGQSGYAYRIRIVPRTWLLTRRTTSRIFQDLTVPDIVTRVLAEHGVAYRTSLVSSYVKRLYCVQYQETDYRFVTRLLAEEGIFFFFDPPAALFGGGAAAAAVSALSNVAASAGLGGVTGALGFTETLVLGDGPAAYGALGAGSAPSVSASVDVSIGVGGLSAGASVSAGTGAMPTLVFRDAVGLVPGGEHVRLFELERAAKSRAALMRDYDFRRPLYAVVGKASNANPMSLSVSLVASTGAGGAAASIGVDLGAVAGIAAPADSLAQVYDHHGEYDVPDFDSRRAGVLLEQLRRKAQRGNGRGYWPQMSPGRTFVLDEHPSAALNRPYVLTRVEHEGHQSERWGTQLQDRPPYENRFQCTFAEQAMRPRRVKRRLRQSMETATVVGPQGEEIHTDALGRIKVQFHWDLDGKMDEHSSCWIRVNQAWAGAGWGFQFIPRVGMEVIVAFVGGDPDRPMVLGCVYNGTHPTANPLPVRKTRGTIRSQSSPGGGGWNEISFEDLAGQEDLFLHAQKDMTEEVLHDRTASVGHDLAEAVGNDKRLHVGGKRSDTVVGGHTIAVGSDHVLNVGGQERVAITGMQSLTVGQDAIQHVGGQQKLEVVGNRGVIVQGDASERIHGDRASYVFGEEARTVWQNARLSFNQACGLTVSKDFALTVGSVLAPGTARAIVQGDTTSTVAGASTVTIGKSLVLRVGDKNKITIDDSGVQIESSAIVLSADSIMVQGSKGQMQVDDNVALSAKQVTVFSTDGGILELTKNAQLDGTQLLLNCQNSAQQTQAQKKKDEAKSLPKIRVTLFDRNGNAIDGAPYEVSCQGYLANGTAPGGIVEIPEFPGVEKCQVRWARLMADRKAEIGESTEELPPFEFEMDVYLAFDAADDSENVLRKLHNMGHQGTADEAMKSFYAANGIHGGKMTLDDIKGQVESLHGAQQPIVIKNTTGDD